jgi:uncharacterized protein DUF5908
MKVEVRELIIKATIVPDVTGGSDNNAAKSNSSANNNVSPNEQLINMCVEKILEILKEKNGR